MTEPESTDRRPTAAQIRRLLTGLYDEAARARATAQDAAVRFTACEPAYRAAEAAAVEAKDWEAASSAHTRSVHVLEGATNAVVEAAVALHHFEAALAAMARVDPEAAYAAAEEAAAGAGDHVAAAGYAAARAYARRAESSAGPRGSAGAAPQEPAPGR